MSKAQKWKLLAGFAAAGILIAGQLLAAPSAMAVPLPGAPVLNSAVQNHPAQVMLDFSAPAGETGLNYRVYAADSASGPVTESRGGTCYSVSPSVVTIADSPCYTSAFGGANPGTDYAIGTTYFFNVKAINSDGNEGPASATKSLIFIGAPDGVPTAVDAVQNGPDQYSVSWTTPPSTPANPFEFMKIRVRVGSGSYQTITTGPCANPSTSPCNAGGFNGGENVRFRLIPANHILELENNMTTSQKTVGQGPGVVLNTTVPVSPTQEQLNGMVADMSTPISDIYCRYATTAAGVDAGTQLAATPGSLPGDDEFVAVSCNASGLAPGTTYYYKIYAASQPYIAEPLMAASFTTAAAPASDPVTTDPTTGPPSGTSDPIVDTTPAKKPDAGTMTASNAFGKKGHRKTNLAGATAKQKATVYIYRAASKRGAATLVAVKTSKHGVWTARKVSTGQGKRAFFCALSGGKMSSTIRVNASRSSAVVAKAIEVSPRGDVVRCR